MGKAIKEKTFELNITNELLDLSKSFLWYLKCSPFSNALPPGMWAELLYRSSFYALGLSQEEEADDKKGGYDVSINLSNPFIKDARIMFLQYKSGFSKTYCNHEKSEFNRIKNSGDKRHIMFNFNDAAKKTQHFTLRNLANNLKVPEKSVMYVFPRMTELEDFKSKLGNLIFHSSFVPVIDIDKQAKKNDYTITKDTIHHYRTSYDGKISEINYYYYYYHYDITMPYNLLAELICVQLERFLKLSKTYNLLNRESSIIENVRQAVLQSVDAMFGFIKPINKEYDSILIKTITKYLNEVQEYQGKEVPSAPANYTLPLKAEGVKLTFENKVDLASINYQLF